MNEIDADKTLERRAIGRDPARTQEISALDILEDAPIDPDIPIEEAPEELAARPEPPSIAPIALDTKVHAGPRISRLGRLTADSTFQIDAIPMNPHRRRLGGVVLSAMAGSFAILLVAAVRTASATGGDAPRTREVPRAMTQAAGSPGVAPANAAPFHAVSTMSTGDHELSSTSTISTMPGVRPLVVDGKHITASSAVVSCGQHLIRAGRGHARSVQVPCGQTLLFDRAGKTTIQ